MASNERRYRKAGVLSSESSGAIQTSPIPTDPFLKDTFNFLSKHNISGVINEALNCLVHNRPENPIHFLMNYFAPSSLDPVNEAYVKLSWSHFSKKAYQRNILEVYNTLVSLKNKNSNLHGLLGDRFNEILLKLSCELPKNIGPVCMTKLRARDTQVIHFNRFYRAILLLHVMKDFIETLLAIYMDLDVYNVGRATESLCNIILSKLRNIISPQLNQQRTMTSFVDKFDSIGISDSICSLAALEVDDPLVSKLQDMLETSSSDQFLECMEEDEFVRIAVEIFLDKV